MTKKTKAFETCSICRGPIEINYLTQWRYGHNAQPVNDGRCCVTCNDTVVIPMRLRRIYGDKVQSC
jgi:hypothetical protein